MENARTVEEHLAMIFALGLENRDLMEAINKETAWKIPEDLDVSTLWISFAVY